MACGSEQMQVVDYGEIFASDVKYSSVPTLCAEVVSEDLVFEQTDVKTAFLN